MAAVKAGDVVWNITGDTKGLNKSLKISSQSVRALGVGITAMGAGIVTTLGLSVKSFASLGDEIQKMSLRTGISTESLSELKVAAELSGSSLATVEKGVKRMAKFLNDATIEMDTTSGAGGRMAGILDQIGLSIGDLQGLSPEESFNRLSEAIAGVNDPLTRAAVAQEVFGRAGTELLPMLSQGVEGLEAMRAKAHELGVVFDEEAANKAAAFQDAMLELGLSFDSIKFALAENLIPILVDDVIPAIIDTVKAVRGWIDENPGWTETLIKVAAAVGGISLVVGPLLILMPGIVAAFGLFSGAAGVLAGGAALGGVAASAAALIPILGAAGLAGVAAAGTLIIAGTAIAFHNAAVAEDELRQATERFGPQVEFLAAEIERMGGTVDRAALAELNLQQQHKLLGDQAIALAESQNIANESQETGQDTTEGLTEKYGDWVNQLSASSRELLAQHGAVGGAGKSFNLLTGEVQDADSSIQDLTGDIWALTEAIQSIPPIPNLGVGPGPNLPGMAAGGISPGGLTMLHEQGPEAVFLPKGAEVIPAPQTAQMMAAAGPVTVNVNMGGVTVGGDMDAQRLADTVAGTTRRELIGLGFATA